VNTDQKEVQVEKFTAYFGGGHQRRMFAVIEDGVFVQSFVHYFEARTFADARLEPWLSKDE